MRLVCWLILYHMLLFLEEDSRVSELPYLAPIFKGARFALKRSDQKCVVVFWLPEILVKVCNPSQLCYVEKEDYGITCEKAYLKSHLLFPSNLASNSCFLLRGRINHSINQNFNEMQSVNSPMLLIQDHHTSFDPSIRYKVRTDEHIINIQFWITPDLRLPLANKCTTILSMNQKVRLQSCHHQMRC